MRTLDQVMAFTRTVSSHAAFEDDECRKYYDLLSALEPSSIIVEIGLQYGRSSSIALQVAQDRNLTYWGVDPFTQPPEAKDAWLEMMLKVGGCQNFATLHASWPNVGYEVAGKNPIHHILLMRSELTWPFLPHKISVALVDGDHGAEYVRKDCDLLMPRIVPGGYLLLHDFGRDSLPDVYPTAHAAIAESTLAGSEWQEEPTVGCLGIFRKIK